MDGLNMALALPAVGQISVYFLRHTLVCLLKDWSGSGTGTKAERAENLVIGSRAMSGCKNNHWSVERNSCNLSVTCNFMDRSGLSGA